MSLVTTPLPCSKRSIIVTKKGLVSVIIPTYNRPQYLPQAVESVFCQTYPNIEIIIIDDGSEENGAATREALRPYLSQVTYVYQPNCGIGGAVNRGLELASGEYIQHLDDDDILHPEKIAKSVEVFLAQPKVGLVATAYHIIDEKGERMRTEMARRYQSKTRLFKMLMACISAQAAVMVRSVCHKMVGKYRTDIMGEDYEMWIRIADL